MTTGPAAQALWQSQARGDVFPDAWRGKLDTAQAYRVQLAILDRKLARGEKQVGWKVGLTAPAMREMFGSDAPVFGYLLESGRIESGFRFRYAGLRTPMVENELLITMASDLAGPSATAEDARNTVATIAPAFEIVEMRGADMRADLPLALTDNVAQRAFVQGAAIPFAPALDLGAIRAEVRINGELKHAPLGREAIDNQLQTLAWLANTLHSYGKRLQAGQCVMTGSFTKPLPIMAGDAFETSFSGIGTVGTSFA
jgi:2-keto-4-pentenoate hydratase